MLGTFTILLDKDSGLFADTFERHAVFDGIGSIRPGDRILLRGMEIGKVARIELTEDASQIRLKLKLTREVPLYEDYLMEIRSSSVLGGTFIYMEAGSPDKPLYPADRDLIGSAPSDVFTAAGGLVGAAKRLLDNLNEDHEKLRAVLIEGGVPDKLDVMVTNMRDITEHIKAGEGNLGKLLYDDTAYMTMSETFKEFEQVAKKATAAIDNLEQAGQIIKDAGSSVRNAADGVRQAADSIESASSNLDNTITVAREGDGTFARLIHDDTLYDDFRRAASDVSNFTKRLNNDDSTVAKLLSDEGQLYSSAQDAFATVNDAASSAKQIADNVNAGKGTLGRLVTDESLYTEATETMKDIRTVTAQLGTGEGTLGKLLHDEHLYEEMDSTMQDIRGAVNDFREQVPLTTFGSFMFRGL